MISEREKTISTIDDFLTYLSCANEDLSEFDKAIAIHQDLTDSCYGMTKENVFNMGTLPDTLDKSWTVSVLSRPYRSIDGVKIADGKFTLYKSKTIARSEFERQFQTRIPLGKKHYYDCYARQTDCTVDKSGRVWKDTIYTAFRGSSITVIDPSRRVTDEGIYTREWDKQDAITTRLLLSAANAVRCCWQAHVSLGGKPRLTLLTDPTGVKDLWKFRDVPAGKSRRDALLHWVSEHWRKSRHDPDIESYVRKHLRGQRVLTCNGLHVEIEEPESDKSEVLNIKTSRNLMRLKKMDRRPR